MSAIGLSELLVIAVILGIIVLPLLIAGGIVIALVMRQRRSKQARRGSAQDREEGPSR